MLGHELSLSHFDILALSLIAVLASGPSHALEVDEEHLGLNKYDLMGFNIWTS